LSITAAPTSSHISDYQSHPEHLQPPSRPVREAAKTAPIIISSGSPHAASPQLQQATEPQEEQLPEPLWGNPDYEDFGYSKARALCQQRRIPNTGSLVTVRNHLIRDDTNMCTGKDREYALPQDRKYYTHKIRKRTRGEPTDGPETAASGSGEPEDDAGDERELSDGFEFDLDFDEIDWEINALPDNQPQPQEDPVLASGAQAAPLVANKPEEMDWEAGVAMAQTEGIPESAAGQPGVHRARVSTPRTHVEARREAAKAVSPASLAQSPLHQTKAPSLVVAGSQDRVSEENAPKYQIRSATTHSNPQTTCARARSQHHTQTLQPQSPKIVVEPAAHYPHSHIAPASYPLYIEVSIGILRVFSLPSSHRTCTTRGQHRRTPRCPTM
jgi:hypothetical protein